MDWHFEQNGKAMGPVSDSQLEDLVRSGTVSDVTLVWHEGMDKWQTYGAVRSTASPPGLQEGATPFGTGDQVRCAECGRFFSTDNLVFISNTLICGQCKPVFLQKLKEGVAGGRLKLWRQGRVLVMSHDAELPDRCVKCNTPANGGRLPRNLYWHHPAYYLFIFLNLLIYVVVALIVRKRAKISVGICEKHRTARVRAIIIAWTMVLLGGGGIGVGISASNGWIGFAGVVLFLTGIIYGAVRARVVTARRIETDRIWLNGVCAAYLEGFPDWTG